MQTVMNVGPNEVLTNGIAWTKAMTAASKLAKADVLVAIAVAEYLNDTYWIGQFMSQTTLDGGDGHGGRATLRSTGTSVPGIKGLPNTGTMANKGIIVVRGRDTVVRNLILDGARCGTNNAGGIRLDGGVNLTVKNTLMRNNNNGMLTSPQDDPATPDVDERGILNIISSEFNGNGVHGGGQAHGIYIGKQKLASIYDTLFTNAIAGHQFKSRADALTMLSTALVGGTNPYSYEGDFMGGAINIENGKITKSAASVQTTSLHIYNEPQSKPTSINITDTEFDLRAFTKGKPIVVDPRIMHQGDGGIGLDGQHHGKGQNYYLPNEYRPCPGLVKNCVVRISRGSKVGLDPATGKRHLLWIPHVKDYEAMIGGLVPFPQGLVEENIDWVEE